MPITDQKVVYWLYYGFYINLFCGIKRGNVEKNISIKSNSPYLTFLKVGAKQNEKLSQTIFNR